jgi:prepilin-type N-terminal cleavage/methylation domain-containing protein
MVDSRSINTGTRRVHWREQHGVTLIELLVAMIMALVVSLAAFSILEFTSSDVSRITSRAHVDQTGRIALQKIMLALHSSCVALEDNPIVEGSTAEKIKFISASGTQATFATGEIYMHVITYTPASGKVEGTLTEQTFPSTSSEGSGTATSGNPGSGNYFFSTTPSSTTKLLTGVEQSESGGAKIPIFQYYKYYKKGETLPTGDVEAPYGELIPVGTGFTTEEAERVAKTTISFTLKPEGTESVIAKGDQPIALEDSAVFRLTPSSTSSEGLNAPCSEAP